MLLDLKIKTAIEKKLSGYRVYQKDGAPEIVQADTVAEAMEKTTIKEPTKIEKIGIINKSLFSEDELEEITKADLQESGTNTENVLVSDANKYSDTENSHNPDDDVNVVIEENGSVSGDDNSNVDMSV